MNQTLTATCLLASALALALPLPAQTGDLPAGSFLAATSGWTYPAGPVHASDSVQVVDPFARTATRLAIAGFPTLPGEAPAAVHVETPQSFLLGSWVLPLAPAGGPVRSGVVYRVTRASSGWSAQPLTNDLGEGVIALAVIGTTIYAKTTLWFSRGGTPGTKVWSVVPNGGGTARVLVDLTALGATGIGGALVVVGSTLHAFTFVSETTASLAGEHWLIDPASGTATNIGSLPVSMRPSSVRVHFGAQQAKWDARTRRIVLVGIWGDVLWLDPGGATMWKRALPGPAQNPTDFLQSVAIDTDTGAVVLGDSVGHVEELRCPEGRFHLNRTTLATVPDGWVVDLDYVPGAARYLPTGVEGCPDGGAPAPCSYANSRPTPGNAAFAFTLETNRTSAVLLIGVSDTSWQGLSLPFDLTPFGAAGCLVGTSADVCLPATGPDPVVPVALPNAALQAFTQWAVFAPQANALGIVLSDVRRL